MTLKAYYFVARIWVETALIPSERAFNDHVEHFRCIVDHASLAIRQRAIFIFKSRIIPPLYFTAVKCRVSKIRKRALSVLSLVPRREGLWDRDEYIGVAKRVIDLEESSNLERLFLKVSIGQQRTMNRLTEVIVTYCWQPDESSEKWATSCESIIIPRNPP